MIDHPVAVEQAVLPFLRVLTIGTPGS